MLKNKNFFNTLCRALFFSKAFYVLLECYLEKFIFFIRGLKK